MKITSFFLDIIYPRCNTCLFCHKNLLFSEIEGLCTECLQKISFLNDYCSICGRPIIPGKSICVLCQGEKWYFENARAVATYSGLMKEIILHFKYFNEQELALPLGKLLCEFYNYYYGKMDIDYIIPIPLHKSKEEMRGYNQAGLLASKLGKFTGNSVLQGCLIRKRETLPLYNLNWQERKKVVKGVFTLSGQLNLLRDNNVLLVDDIFTSGSTVNEAAKVLHNQGKVQNVYVLTLATYANHE